MANDLNADKARYKVAKDDGSGYLNSLVVKRSVVVGSHKTSISLEEPFWNALRTIARERSVTLSRLMAGIDGSREHDNLSSAIRIFVFEHCRSQKYQTTTR